MKMGDLVECRHTKDRGFIVGTRTSIGGKGPAISVAYSIDWLAKSTEKDSWIPSDKLKVVKSNE